MLGQKTIQNAGASQTVTMFVIFIDPFCCGGGVV